MNAEQEKAAAKQKPFHLETREVLAACYLGPNKGRTMLSHSVEVGASGMVIRAICERVSPLSLSGLPSAEAEVETMNCPKCGGPLDYDEVDIGVGTLRGNAGCPDCHWTPAEEPEEEILVIVRCPECGAEHEDLDGFGFVFCAACGYCTHPSRTDDICGICKKRVTTCLRCHGHGSTQGMEAGFGGVDQGAECGDCEGAGIIVEEVSS